MSEPARRFLKSSSRPLSVLLTDYVVFSLCSNELIHKVVRKSLKFHFSTQLLEFVMRGFLFNRFYGGDSIEECKSIGNSLHSNHKLRLIIDGSKENVGEDSLHQNVIEKIEAIQTCSRYFGAQCKFMPVKITSIIHHKTLELMVGLLNDGKQIDFWSSSNPMKDMMAAMDSRSADKLKVGVDQLTSICKVAADHDIALLFDAEESHLQPGIELLYRIIVLNCSQQFSKKPLLLNTYQVYLRRTEAVLQKDLSFFRQHNLQFGIKLVRGAYMKSEILNAQRLRLSNPLQSSKEQTDKVYDKIARQLVELLANNQDQLVIMFATHNKNSVTEIIKSMNMHRIAPYHDSIHFGQILGMADRLSSELGCDGFNCNKLVLFGKFQDLLPWLIRRLDENKDGLGAMQQERQEIRRELAAHKERFFRKLFGTTN